MNSFGLRCICVLVIAFSVMITAGCEDDVNTDELESYFEENPYENLDRPESGEERLGVWPSSQTLSYNGASLNLEANGGNPPYSWTVVDVGLGSIVEEGGQERKTVVYQRDAAGDNVVVVRDQNGDEAYCIVQQPAE